MNFLHDYLFYNEGNEADRQHHIWSALTLVSTVIGRRVWFREAGEDTYKQLTFYPNLYVCLVGVQGSGKSFAKDGTRDIIATEFPDIPTSPNVDTVQRLTMFMGSSDCRRALRTDKGTLIEYTPVFLVVNELKNFLQVNPTQMIDFLVDIYDRNEYSVKTKSKGEDEVILPYVTVLACATTEFIVDQLRDKVLSGGLARRMIFVNVTKERERKPENRIPPRGKEALARAIAHLHRLRDIYGEFVWATPDDKAYYTQWYMNPKIPSDSFMAGFERTKKTQLIKISMLLALCEYEPKLVITKQHLGKALLLLNDISPNMERLFASAGRNILSVPTLNILDLLETHGGMLPEKDVIIAAGRDLQPFEVTAVLHNLRATERIVYARLRDSKGVERSMILTKAKADAIKTGEVQ